MTQLTDAPPWREAGLRYFSYNFHLRKRFGRRVHKVSVDAGFTCPNVDGTVTVGGCNFCDNRSFRAIGLAARLRSCKRNSAVVGRSSSTAC